MIKGLNGEGAELENSGSFGHMQCAPTIFMMFFCGVILVMSFFFQGCSPFNMAETEKKIVEYDPSFQKLLNKRNSLQCELDRKKTIFREKKQKINDKIKGMQEEKLQLEKEQLSLEEQITRQIQPEKRELKKSLMEISYQYKQKSELCRSIDRDIDEINSLIKKKESLSLTQEEMRIWNERLASLIENKENVNLEKNKLKEEIEITKLKIKVFR